MEAKVGYENGQQNYFASLKEGLSTATCTVHFVINPNSNSLTVYIL